MLSSSNTTSDVRNDWISQIANDTVTTNQQLDTVAVTVATNRNTRTNNNTNSTTTTSSSSSSSSSNSSSSNKGKGVGTGKGGPKGKVATSDMDDDAKHRRNVALLTQQGSSTSTSVGTKVVTSPNKKGKRKQVNNVW